MGICPKTTSMKAMETKNAGQSVSPGIKAKKIAWSAAMSENTKRTE